MEARGHAASIPPGVPRGSADLPAQEPSSWLLQRVPAQQELPAKRRVRRDGQLLVFSATKFWSSLKVPFRENLCSVCFVCGKAPLL